MPATITLFSGQPRPLSELILEGSYGGNQVFHADAILVKCPSKYVDLNDELNSAQNPSQS